MKNSSILISILFLISMLTACVSTMPISTPTRDSDKIATIVAATLSAIPSSTPIPIPTDTPTVDEWIWHNIDLYDIKLKLPPGWTVSEVNRRLEPTGPGYPTPVHDCAEYNIANPDGTMKLFLKPDCVFFEANPDYCPNNIVLMSRHSDAVVRYYDKDGIIGRYYDSSKSAYIYTGVGFPIWKGQIVMACYSPSNIAIRHEQKPNFIFIYVEFQYLGTETNINQILNMMDEIVLSLSKQ